MRLCYAFLEFVLPFLNEFNTAFQSGEPMIGHLHTETSRLLRKLMGRFVTTKVIREEPDLTKIDYREPANQHDDERLALGWKTREYLDNEDVTQYVQQKFLSHVRAFYCKLVETMVAKFPMKDSVLKAVGFLNPETRDAVTPDQVGALAERFLGGSKEETASVVEEFEDYLLQPTTEFTSSTSDPCKPVSLETYWDQVAQKKAVATGKQIYGKLCMLARAVLSLPHSNADPERIFSQLRKIQADSRDNLSNKTVNSLLSVKTNCDDRCCEYRPSTSVLSAVRKACIY